MPRAYGKSINDLKVSDIKVQKKIGNNWVNIPSNELLTTNNEYMLNCTFNNHRRISWPASEQVWKEDISVFMNFLGFNQVGVLIWKNELEFYTDQSFSRRISGSKNEGVYRFPSGFRYRPDDIPVQILYYFKIKNSLVGLTHPNKMRWSIGILASLHEIKGVWMSRYSH